MITEQRVRELLVAALRENASAFSLETVTALNEETVLFGTKSVLDSIAFINFTTDVEEKICKETGVPLALKLYEIHDRNAGKSVLTLGAMARIVTEIALRDCVHVK